MTPQEIKKLIAQMTLEEKASLCSGLDFWNSKALERLGIQSFMLTDGPHGVRKQITKGDSPDLHASVPATCFPSGAGLASTWNKQLLEQVGRALGQEARKEEVGVLLGPAVNMKRSPLGGRNFEYLSEDPCLAGQLAKHHILGVQSQGVGSSIKHFAANNQEKLRMVIDTVVDERTLREIYLRAFEIAVTEAQPWTVMSAYNRINGTFCSENPWLLTQVLRKEWGFEGVVVTDWGANCDRPRGLAAGQDLEMPGNSGIGDKEILEALKKGKLSPEILDLAVERHLTLYSRIMEGKKIALAEWDHKSHHLLARQVARESMVLLKNEKNILPLKQSGKVAFIGDFAQNPRYQGGGSSHMVPTEVETPWDEAKKMARGWNDFELIWAQGYRKDAQVSDKALLEEAQKVAQAVDTAVVFIGLTDALESEGYDRKDLCLPKAHVELLQAILQVQKRVVVVISSGSPVEMPWLSQVPGVLQTYLAGQAGGGAAVEILFGLVNPSGKLAETYPQRIQDTPCYLNFPGDSRKVEYREGVFIGYRWYDSRELTPLFPFGYGLSYTQFALSDLQISQKEVDFIKDSKSELTVKVKITNTGKSAGAEVAQLYLRDEKASVIRPFKELKAFEKIYLKPQESQIISLKLTPRDFAFWDEESRDWVIESGSFTIFIGTSSAELPLKTTLEVKAPLANRLWDKNSVLEELINHPVVGEQARQYQQLFIKNQNIDSYDPQSAEAIMTKVMSLETPLRNIAALGSALKQEDLEDFLKILNSGNKKSE